MKGGYLYTRKYLPLCPLFNIKHISDNIIEALSSRCPIYNKFYRYLRHHTRWCLHPCTGYVDLLNRLMEYLKSIFSFSIQRLNELFIIN